ncbi:dehydrogenase [Candidatus Entotheonella serta]|nr:dehydrogenase [Candidatus Entotheonella serta]
MRSKAAVLVGPNTPLVIDEVDFPDPAPDQVLVKLFASGICHSQLHQIHRTPETAHRGTPAVFPSLLGHEATGVVVAAGNDVPHVREGDHVMTTWVDRGAVEGAPPRAPVSVQWRNQSVPAGPATWTEYALLSEQLVVPLDAEVATDVTSIIGCAVLTGSGMILNTLEVQVSESVAVFGAGGVGLCAIAAAHIVGAYPIIAVDLSDDKLEFAKRFGATHGVNAANGDPVEAIHEISGGGVEYAIDAIGAKSTQEQILYGPPRRYRPQKRRHRLPRRRGPGTRVYRRRRTAYYPTHLYRHPGQPMPSGSRFSNLCTLVSTQPAQPR